jgi:hypothetical protein
MRSSQTGGPAVASADFPAIKVWFLTAAADQIAVVLFKSMFHWSAVRAGGLPNKAVEGLL